MRYMTYSIRIFGLSTKGSTTCLLFVLRTQKERKLGQLSDQIWKPCLYCFQQCIHKLCTKDSLLICSSLFRIQFVNPNPAQRPSPHPRHRPSLHRVSMATPRVANPIFCEYRGFKGGGKHPGPRFSATIMTTKCPMP